MSKSSEAPKSSAPVLEPHERLKKLTNYCNALDIDPSVPPRRYYRSGLEMVRMANVYLEEGSMENAYVLYMKFMTLFIEKIREHPEYNLVPVEMKSINSIKLREVLPKAEALKAKLIEQYAKEYQIYQQEERLEKLKKRDVPKVVVTTKPQPSAPQELDVVQIPPKLRLDNINYPDSVKNDDLKPPSTKDSDVKSNSLLMTLDTGKVHNLRTIVIPSKVMTEFIKISQPQTFQNIETCGVLAGKLKRDHLIVTHMIIPKQRGTSDSCATMNEEEIFDYQDQKNLITLGWIHTHPTQTAFLSSVDLHTHCSYQIMMPEAIAIVCAPKYDDSQIFVLTPDHGLNYIANCKLTGFHPHPSTPPLFMVASHTKMDPLAPIEIVDLRKI